MNIVAAVAPARPQAKLVSKEECAVLIDLRTGPEWLSSFQTTARDTVLWHALAAAFHEIMFAKSFVQIRDGAKLKSKWNDLASAYKSATRCLVLGPA